jgi:hypothetical protein
LKVYGGIASACKWLMSKSINRREFLKVSGLAAAAAAVGLGFRDFPPGGDPALKRVPAYRLGRVIYSERYYELPTIKSKELGYYNRDAVVNIIAQSAGDPQPTHNPIWLRTDKGWLHSANVQPVEDRWNEPVLDIPSRGLLAEVTVPFTQAYLVNERGRKRFYRCYYASTYWVHHVFKDGLGRVWYQIWDERNEEYYQVLAEHLRPLTAEDLAPLAPGAPNKSIQIDLQRQRLIAYQGAQPVFTARIATGYFEGDTPTGEFKVERKQPTRHMASNLDGHEFDLPGVPWVCYISWTGVSIHGTYWHHNYGTPQSHGCINLLPEAARWVYRWTEPVADVTQNYVESDSGTRVIVF